MEKQKKTKSFFKTEALFGVLFASPAIIGFLVFTSGPMIASLIFSFTNYRIANAPQWIGLQNYISIFDGTDFFFYTSLKVTLIYVAITTPLELVFAFLCALLFDQNVRGKGIFRTIFYIPYMIPAVAMSMIWMWLLDPDLGFMNQFLHSIGLPTSLWLLGESSVLPTLIILNLFLKGNTMIIFLAALQDVPGELVEALRIDGGNALDRLRYVIIPLMTPTIFFNLVMGLFASFQSFTNAYVMTEGGPNNKSLFFTIYMFREAFSYQKMGYASALSWIYFLIISLCTFIIFKTSQRWVHYEIGG